MPTYYRLVHGRVVRFTRPTVDYKPSPVPQQEFQTVQTTGNISPPGPQQAAPNGARVFKTEATGRKPQRTLKRKELFQLYKILEEWKNELHETRPTFESVAERATTALGFDVTRVNVHRAAADMGILWKVKRSGGKHKESGGKRYYRYVYINNRTEVLERQVEILRRELFRLYRIAGAPVPDSLDDLPASGGAWPKPAEPDGAAESAGQ